MEIKMNNLPQAVQSQISKPVMIWANFMGFVLIVGSAIFMFSHTAAMLIFTATIASFAIAFTLFQFRPNIYVVGIPQIVLWSPLLVYIYSTEFAGGVADFSLWFTRWLTLAAVIMLVSVLFDIRDLYLMITQGRGNSAHAADQA
jgi:hypothetical protein